MYSTWAYLCTKYRRNQILSSIRPIFDPYWHQLLNLLVFSYPFDSATRRNIIGKKTSESSEFLTSTAAQLFLSYWIFSKHRVSSFTPSPFSSVCFLSGFGMKYVYQSFFYYIFLLIATLLSQPHVSYLFCSVLLLRWGGCSKWWSLRNTENQQNSETLNHHNDESWTKTQHWTEQCYVLISEK